MVLKSTSRRIGKGRSSAPTLQSRKSTQRKEPEKRLVRNAIPQKVLAYAARLTKPPAISNEIPDEMPFPTDEQ